MIVKINPSAAFGRIKAPPSKSMAHRLLICGAFSNKSVISDVSFSKDIEATLSCLKSLGAEISVNGDEITIGGLNAENNILSNKLFCNESGSTLRFFIPLCLLFNREISLTGSERLFERPLTVYEGICQSQDIFFKKSNDCVTVNGRLKAGKYIVRGDISSQFISGLMLALPLLDGDSIIEVSGGIESGSYLNLTIKALADFGVRITRYDERTFHIKGNQTFKNRKLSVEGDYSNAAFFEALNLVGGNVAVVGLSEASAQGDRIYGELFNEIEKCTPTIDISDCPDLAPILITVAALKNGAVFKGTRRLEIKESNRGRAIADELSKFGAKVVVRDNEIIVLKSELHSPKMPLSSHNDHRIAMALSVICTVYGGEIYGAEAVSKSFPAYFKCLKSLGIDLEEIGVYEA